VLTLQRLDIESRYGGERGGDKAPDFAAVTGKLIGLDMWSAILVVASLE